MVALRQPLLLVVAVVCVVLLIRVHVSHAFRRQQRAASPEVEEKDLYAVLGVPRDADEGAIRKAYRQLSRQYHPDKNPGDAAAAEKFRAISEANEILSDEEKKFVYDRGGMAAVAEADQPQGHDPFAAFFGHSATPSGAPRTDPLHFEVPISLATLYTGDAMQTSIKVLTHCEGCTKGSPERGSPKCKACRARCPNEIKMVQRQVGPGFLVNQQTEVPSDEKCQKESRTLDLLIEKGARSGEELAFKGQGNRHPNKLPGDVFVKIKEQPHDFFTRSGNDLLATWKISLKEALVGGSWSFPALDGHEIKFGTEGVTKPGATWRIAGEVSGRAPGAGRPATPATGGVATDRQTCCSDCASFASRVRACLPASACLHAPACSPVRLVPSSALVCLQASQPVRALVLFSTAMSGATHVCLAGFHMWRVFRCICLAVWDPSLGAAQGMPVHNFPSESGDLIITFEVEFPKGPLSERQAQLVHEALLQGGGGGGGAAVYSHGNEL
jgi:DnaJ-class molecular chaperone